MTVFEYVNEFNAHMCMGTIPIERNEMSTEFAVRIKQY